MSHTNTVFLQLKVFKLRAAKYDKNPICWQKPACTLTRKIFTITDHWPVPSSGVASAQRRGATTSPGHPRPAPLTPPPSYLFRPSGACLAGSPLRQPNPGWGRGRARPRLGPLSSHLFERRLFRRALAGGTGRSQKRKMVPRILSSHLYIPGPSSSGGRHTPRRKPQSCRRRCRLRCLGHRRHSSVADLWRDPRAHRYNVPRATGGPRGPPLLTSPPPARPESILALNLRRRSLDLHPNPPQA